MQYLIQPYAVGKNKHSIAMILPSDIVKSHNIDPLSTYLIIKVRSKDELQLRVIGEEDLKKGDSD